MNSVNARTKQKKWYEVLIYNSKTSGFINARDIGFVYEKYSSKSTISLCDTLREHNIAFVCYGYYDKYCQRYVVRRNDHGKYYNKEKSEFEYRY